MEKEVTITIQNKKITFLEVDPKEELKANEAIERQLKGLKQEIQKTRTSAERYFFHLNK